MTRADARQLIPVVRETIVGHPWVNAIKKFNVLAPGKLRQPKPRPIMTSGQETEKANSIGLIASIANRATTVVYYRHRAVSVNVYICFSYIYRLSAMSFT